MRMGVFVCCLYYISSIEACVNVDGNFFFENRLLLLFWLFILPPFSPIVSVFLLSWTSFSECIFLCAHWNSFE